MATEENIAIKKIGDDTPPLMNLVPEAPPSHWGKLTGQGRTCSQEYLRFLHGGVKCQKKSCTEQDCRSSKN